MAFMEGNTVKQLFWKCRLACKYVWRYVGRSWRLIEFCKVCGRRQPVVWNVPDVFWWEVTGSRHGVLCVECFNRRATEQGWFLIWTCEPQRRQEAGTEPAADKDKERSPQ